MQTAKEKDRRTESQTEKLTNRKIDIHIHTVRESGRQTNRPTDGCTAKHTEQDRQTDTHTLTIRETDRDSVRLTDRDSDRVRESERQSNRGFGRTDLPL